MAADQQHKNERRLEQHVRLGHAAHMNQQLVSTIAAHTEKLLARMQAGSLMKIQNESQAFAEALAAELESGTEKTHAPAPTAHDPVVDEGEVETSFGLPAD